MVRVVAVEVLALASISLFVAMLRSGRKCSASSFNGSDNGKRSVPHDPTSDRRGRPATYARPTRTVTQRKQRPLGRFL